MDREKNEKVHIETVTGVIQVILFIYKIREEGREGILMDDVYKAGTEGKCREASSFILEFIKDGLVNLREESAEKVKRGDYDWVWKCTNDFLSHFGYEPIEPVEITLP